MKLLGMVLIFVASVVPPAAAQSCDIPAGYANSVSVTEGPYWIGFATDKGFYVPGEPLMFYLVVKNVSAEEQSFNFGVSPEDAYVVSPDTCTAPLTQPCYDTLYDYPPFVYYYNSGTTLAPGECRVWTHTSTSSPFDMSHIGGVFNVHGGLYEALPELGWALPSNGLMLTVFVQTVGTDERSWGAVKAMYR